MASYPCYKVGMITSAILLVILTSSSSAHKLSAEFYSKTCPNLLATVKSLVQDAINNETRMGASLLRLHFHDCFVNGCDASILLDDTASLTGEKTAAPNQNSARGFEVIDRIKANVEKECERTVSCADILALAARESVFILGGPDWNVGLGRRDATTASLADANDGIPLSNWTLDAIISRFTALRFSTNELIALLGAHSMKQTNNSATINFDKNYYNNKANIEDCSLKMVNGKETKSIVNGYSDNPKAFSDDFATAMIKLGEIKPPTGFYGEIRVNCRKVNN